jgi:hypothetical protein
MQGLVKGKTAYPCLSAQLINLKIYDVLKIRNTK